MSAKLFSNIIFSFVDNVAVRERIDVTTEDKVEMEIYDRDKKYFSECQKRFTEWYNKHSQPRTKSKVAEYTQKYYYNTTQAINKQMSEFYMK